MISKKPYLLRAMYDWIVDNGWTPHVVVDADINPASLPNEYVQDGHIVLNVAEAAVQGLDIGNEEVSFSARFSGQAFGVVFPVESVAGIYARENNEGIQFVVSKVEASALQDPKSDKPVLSPVGSDDENTEKPAPEAKKRPKLTVVSPNPSAKDD